MKKYFAAAAFVALLIPTLSYGQITLQLVNSYARTGTFGLAFDGTNIWYTGATGYREMTTDGVDTGAQVNYSSVSGSSSLNALAWTGTRLAAGINVSGSTGIVRLFDRNGANQSTQNLTGLGIDHAPFDGLDFDHGEWWYSPDQGNIYRNDASGNLIAPVPWKAMGTGGYSGVERVDVFSSSYVFAVNDNFTPRQLAMFDLNGNLLGSFNFANQRYEDLAFDGRYLWAADLGAGRIDKIDVLNNGGSVFVPEPSSMLLLALGGLGLAAIGRRRKK